MSSNPFTRFVRTLESIVSAGTGSEQELLNDVNHAMRALVASDGWLSERFERSDPVNYRQYLLHADSADRFSVVSFVWGPGQQTPIHDHCTWGVVGMLRGSETSVAYTQSESGMVKGQEHTLQPGDVITLSPLTGDIHLVRNAYADRVSISIHAYGANIGKQARHVFDKGSGERKTFVSGYSDAGA
jgi:predicted metal-dependent enzyme (double-stranded beta helix superfamily)